jgi:hypothetical protein
MRRICLANALVLVVAFVADAAPKAGAQRYLGPHPIAKRVGGGYCYIEAPHLHNYLPDQPVFFRDTPKGLAFVADPTPFGYDGERHVFYGHHPVPIEGDWTIYCLLDGPHYHSYAPWGGDDFKTVEGAAFYVGELPVGYVEERAKRWKAVNDAFRPYDLQRPAVHVVTPPPEWAGRTWIPPWVKVQLPKKVRTGPKRHVHVNVGGGEEGTAESTSTTTTTTTITRTRRSTQITR